ncbi:MAG: hypothetical protein ACREOZ_01880, partial [Gloeomargaritales cyanobacterium]
MQTRNMTANQQATGGVGVQPPTNRNQDRYQSRNSAPRQNERPATRGSTNVTRRENNYALFAEQDVSDNEENEELY